MIDRDYVVKWAKKPLLSWMVDTRVFGEGDVKANFCDIASGFGIIGDGFAWMLPSIWSLISGCLILLTWPIGKLIAVWIERRQIRRMLGDERITWQSKEDKP